MFRIAIASSMIAAAISLSVVSALAQTAPVKPKSPGEIAAASRLLTEKQEDCRREANQLKLHFLKRRSFIRNCMRR